VAQGGNAPVGREHPPRKKVKAGSPTDAAAASRHNADLHGHEKSCTAGPKGASVLGRQGEAKEKGKNAREKREGAWGRKENSAGRGKAVEAGRRPG